MIVTLCAIMLMFGTFQIRFSLDLKDHDDKLFGTIVGVIESMISIMTTIFYYFLCNYK